MRGWIAFWTGLRRLFAIWLPAANQTEGMMRALLRIGGLMTASIIGVGLVWQIFPSTREQGTDPSSFVFWSLATAFAAFLSGGATGLLFGLPTMVRRADGGAPSQPGAPASTGYLESTSLEQVADFLVKGLVALTLTTFSQWSARFETLAENVTASILGHAGVSPAPGGLLLTGYALLGFLVAYLWMRRWFIGELVSAQNEQASLLRERIRAEEERVAQARNDSRQGVGSSAANNAEASTQVATRMASQAAQFLQTTQARDGVQAIQDAIATSRDPDDPWKGAFGGLAARNGCVLSANVASLISDPNNFQVDLLLSVDDAHRGHFAGMKAHFFLHPTFGSSPRDVPIGTDGRATLQIFSYGAFTVGVLIDDGTTLELDLAQIAGAPRRFLDR